MLSRPRTAVFIDCDNHSFVRKFVRVLHRFRIPYFLGLSLLEILRWFRVPKKLSPQQISMSVDLEDPIVAAVQARQAVKHTNGSVKTISHNKPSGRP